MSGTTTSWLNLGIIIFIWYVASAICNTSSKKLLFSYAPIPIWLSFVQFAITFIVLRVYLFWIKKTPPPSFDDKNRMIFIKLTISYTLGFVFVNSGYLAVTVSLAETLRSAEPLFSVFFAKLLLKEENISRITLLTLVPIVLGGVLSSSGDTSFTFIGLLFIFGSNTCFALRSIYTKHLKPLYTGNAIQVFYEITVLGCVFLFCFASIMEVSIAYLFGKEYIDYALIPRFLFEYEKFVSMTFFQLVTMNGITYALYNQMSFLVLSYVTVVTHAVGNSFRRVVTILFSVQMFGNQINPQNAFGIFLSVTGVILYSLSKARDEVKNTKSLTARNVV